LQKNNVFYGKNINDDEFINKGIKDIMLSKSKKELFEIKERL
jgi:hypothetical protein